MRRINGYGPSLLVLATTAVVLLAGPAAIKRISYAYTEAEIIQASQRLGDQTILEQINQAYRDIATVVEPSVVHISAEHIVEDARGNGGRRASSGSGWLFDEEGHIVTNQHVIEDANRIEVQLFNGVIKEAQIVGTDPTTDIAVLKIEESQLHPAARRDLTDSPVRQGDMVFAFGSPFDFRFSMSSGVVSGKGRSVGVIRDERGRPFGYENFIQVDAAINPGNSGGPLTDFRGQVIGMNTAIATGRRTPGSFDDGQFAGIGLAIPIEMIEPVVTQIIENGVVTKGFLGLSVVDRTNLLEHELDVLGLNVYGLIVGDLDENSTALTAGVRWGDVITHVNGTRVNSISQFQSMVQAMKNQRVELTIWRFDSERDQLRKLDIALPDASPWTLLGMTLLQADDSVGEAMDLLGFEGQGVKVATLVPNAPARNAGVRRGDFITHVNRTPVGSVQQLRSLISSIRPGQIATLSIWRFDPLSRTSEVLEIGVPLAQLDARSVTGLAPGIQDPSRIPAQNQLPQLGIERMATATRADAGAGRPVPRGRGDPGDREGPGAPEGVSAGHDHRRGHGATGGERRGVPQRPRRLRSAQRREGHGHPA